jgi:hypothetical protein
MSFHHSPKIVTDGLVFYVDPSSPKCYSGGSTCRDLTNLNGEGTLSNVTFTSDKAFKFNNINSTITFTRKFINTTNQCTLFAVIESPTILGGQYGGIVSSINGSSFDGYILGIFITSSPGVQMYAQSDLGLNFASNEDFDTRINDLKIKILAGTVSSQFAKTYINNTLTQTVPPNLTSPPPNFQFQNQINLGGIPGTVDNLINMKIYKAFIYNRVLSDFEILQNFNALKGRFNL